MTGDMNGAIEAYSKAISLNQKYAEAWINRGIVKEMQRDETGACKDWTEAAELGNPDANSYITNCK